MGVLSESTDPILPASAGRRGTTPRVVDGAERLLLLALYGWMVARLVIGSGQDGRLASLLILPSEGLVVLFMLLRRRADEISRHPGEWLLAVAATCAPMLVTTGVGNPLVPPAAGATVLLMGLLVQMHAKVTLGRSFGCIPANRGLKLAGPYRFVRHPMYAGYLLSHLGFLAMNPTPRNLTLYAACYALQVPRLLAEERLLARDARYRDYQATVRYRLIPGVF
jgi:protein-S-isoprenylcysteine O-methyltransferase Ste14